MSAIKLPELPPEVDTVRALFRGQPDHFEAQDYYYTQEQIRAYAEQAVREALAAQVPVAWVIDARRGLSDPQFCWGNPEGIYKSLYVPLALIPEKGHG